MPKNQIHVQKGSIGYNIKVAPNQKVVTTKKVLKPSYVLDIKSNRKAMKELKPSTYMLYMHFVLNKPNYTEALSLKAITESTTLSERTYYAAVKELTEKGYLKRVQNLKYNEYYFLLEDPASSCGETPTPQKSDQNPGEVTTEPI